MHCSVQRICSISSLSCPFPPSLYCFYDVTIKLSLHSAFQLLRNRKRPFSKTKNEQHTPHSQHVDALSIIFSFQCWDVNQRQSSRTHNKRMSNGNLLLSHRYFFLQTASQQLKRSWNTVFFIIFVYVLFYLEKSWREGGIGILFISFLFVRSFSMPPTCL